MFHKSKLLHHADLFPHDAQGFVPTESDQWREMQFVHEQMNPEEPGISDEERARRVEYLDRVWWPRVLADVHEQRLHLEREHGATFMEHWKQVVHQPPAGPKGTEVAPEFEPQ